MATSGVMAAAVQVGVVAVPRVVSFAAERRVLNSGNGGLFGVRLAVGANRSPIVRRPIGITADLQRWERKKVKENSLPIRQTLHVKVGDTVQVIAGSDKKKVGEVVKIFPHNSKIVVKNINFKTKHIKGKAEGEPGQIIQVEASIHSSNVMLYSKKEKVASRVGHKTLEDGRKVRYLVKTGEVLDAPDDWKKLYKKEKKEK